MGLEGTEFPLPPGSDPDGDYNDFTASGAFWLYATDLETTLLGTSDGSTWQTLDLTAHGLPADAHLGPGTGGCFPGPAIDDRGDAMTIVYYTYPGQSHPNGLLDQPWLVDIGSVDGGNPNVTVTPGVDVGLEPTPVPEGGDITVRLADVEAIAGNIVAILKPTYAAAGFTAWVSPDGRTWEQSTIPFPVPDADISVDAVLATDDALLVLTNTSQGTAAEATVWSTTDGVTWSSAVLGGGLVSLGYDSIRVSGDPWR